MNDDLNAARGCMLTIMLGVVVYAIVAGIITLFMAR